MTGKKGTNRRFEIKRRLLKRAFQQERGAEVIAEIQRRTKKIRDWTEPDRKGLLRFLFENAGQPRAVRALNLIEEKNGSGRSFRAQPHCPADIPELEPDSEI